MVLLLHVNRDVLDKKSNMLTVKCVNEGQSQFVLSTQVLIKDTNKAIILFLFYYYANVHKNINNDIQYSACAKSGIIIPRIKKLLLQI